MIVRDSRAKYWKAENGEHHLDIRPILEAGGEPYSVIMDAVGQTERKFGLSIHVLFDPIPLKKQLGRMNYHCDSIFAEEDHWILRIEPHTGAPSL